jgi:hypothetical protein
MGEPLVLPAALTGAAISSRLAYAIARTDSLSGLVLVRNLGAEVAWSELDGTTRDADLISLSNSGRHAAIYNASEGSVRVIGGLPDAPAPAGTYDISGSRLTAIAISDDGRILAASFAAGSADNTSGTLRVLTSETGVWRDLAVVARIQSIVFAPNGQDVAIVDAGAASVSLIRGVAAGGNITTILPQTEAAAMPVAARFTSDSRILIATANGIAAFNLADNTRSDLVCGCTPTGIDELDNGSAFRLTEVSKLPMWILHESTEGMQLVFVPPPPFARHKGMVSR